MELMRLDPEQQRPFGRCGRRWRRTALVLAGLDLAGCC